MKVSQIRQLEDVMELKSSLKNIRRERQATLILCQGLRFFNNSHSFGILVCRLVA